MVRLARRAPPRSSKTASSWALRRCSRTSRRRAAAERREGRPGAQGDAAGGDAGPGPCHLARSAASADPGDDHAAVRAGASAPVARRPRGQRVPLRRGVDGAGRIRPPASRAPRGGCPSHWASVLPGRVWTSLEALVDRRPAPAGRELPRRQAALECGLRSGFAFPITFGANASGCLEFFSDGQRGSPIDAGRLPRASAKPDGSVHGAHPHRNEREILLELSRRRARDAESANRAKDEFLATFSARASHALNAIVGWAPLSKTGQLDEGQRARAVDVIDRNREGPDRRSWPTSLDVSRIVMGKLRLDRPVP